MARYSLLLVMSLVVLVLALWAGGRIVQRPPYAGVELLANGHINEVDAEGPAARAGLQVGEQVRTVDGRPLLRSVSLYQGRSIGETVTFTVHRNGAPVDVPVVLSAVTSREQTFRIERFFVGLIFWLVSTFVWLFLPQDRVACLFFLLSQVMAGMLFGEILDPGMPIMSVFTDLLRLLLAPLALHFLAVFPKPLPRRPRVVLLSAAYGGSVLLALLLFGTLRWSFDLSVFRMWDAPRAFEMTILIVALGILFRPQPSASLDARRRRGILIAGLLLGIAPNLLTQAGRLFDVLPFATPYEWTVPFLALVPLAFAYAVSKGELGHIDLILNRSLVYLFLTAALLGLYVSLYLSLGFTLSDERSWAHLLAGAALIAIGVPVFGPVRTRLQHWVDRLFYGGWYDYRTFVQSVSGELSRTSDLTHLLARIKAAAETMRFQAGALLWPVEDHLVPRGSYGFDADVLSQLQLPAEGSLARHLLERGRPCAQAELRRSLSATACTERERALLGMPEFTYWLPLVCHGVLRSVLVTGRRQGDERLDQEDLDILTTMSTQAAIASENIALLESLRQRLSEVEQVRDELAETKERLSEGREEERRHLARELHDGPVQDLYAMLHELEGLAAAIPLGGSKDRLGPLRTTMQQTAETLRGICMELRPPLLADLGLAVALRSHVARFREKHPGVHVELVLVPHAGVLPERTELALFRICQEALRNAVQHGAATRVHIRFEADAEQLVLRVDDDGCGFEVPDRWIELGRRGHLGLLGMAERTEALRGRLEVRSAPGEGTSIRVVAPRPEAKAGGEAPARPASSPVASPVPALPPK